MFASWLGAKAPPVPVKTGPDWNAFQGAKPPSVIMKHTDWAYETVPRAIINDHVTELLLREEGLSGRPPKYKDLAGLRSVHAEGKAFDDAAHHAAHPPPPPSPQLKKLPATAPQAPSAPESSEETIIVYLSEMGIDIINTRARSVIKPIHKPPMPSPQDAKIYLPSGHKALAPRYARVDRFSSHQNVIARCEPAVRPLAAASAREYEMARDLQIIRSQLRYTAPPRHYPSVQYGPSFTGIAEPGVDMDRLVESELSHLQRRAAVEVPVITYAMATDEEATAVLAAEAAADVLPKLPPLPERQERPSRRASASNYETRAESETENTAAWSLPPSSMEGQAHDSDAPVVTVEMLPHAVPILEPGIDPPLASDDVTPPRLHRLSEPSLPGMNDEPRWGVPEHSHEAGEAWASSVPDGDSSAAEPSSDVVMTLEIVLTDSVDAESEPEPELHPESEPVVAAELSAPASALKPEAEHDASMSSQPVTSLGLKQLNPVLQAIAMEASHVVQQRETAAMKDVQATLPDVIVHEVDTETNSHVERQQLTSASPLSPTMDTLDGASIWGGTHVASDSGSVLAVATQSAAQLSQHPTPSSSNRDARQVRHMGFATTRASMFLNAMDIQRIAIKDKSATPDDAEASETRSVRSLASSRKSTASSLRSFGKGIKNVFKKAVPDLETEASSTHTLDKTAAKAAKLEKQAAERAAKLEAETAERAEKQARDEAQRQLKLQQKEEARIKKELKKSQKQERRTSRRRSTLAASETSTSLTSHEISHPEIGEDASKPDLLPGASQALSGHEDGSSLAPPSDPLPFASSQASDTLPLTTSVLSLERSPDAILPPAGRPVGASEDSLVLLKGRADTISLSSHTISPIMQSPPVPTMELTLESLDTMPATTAFASLVPEPAVVAPPAVAASVQKSAPRLGDDLDGMLNPWASHAEMGAEPLRAAESPVSTHAVAATATSPPASVRALQRESAPERSLSLSVSTAGSPVAESVPPADMPIDLAVPEPPPPPRANPPASPGKQTAQRVRPVVVSVTVRSVSERELLPSPAAAASRPTAAVRIVEEEPPASAEAQDDRSPTADSVTSSMLPRHVRSEMPSPYDAPTEPSSRLGATGPTTVLASSARLPAPTEDDIVEAPATSGKRSEPAMYAATAMSMEPLPEPMLRRPSQASNRYREPMGPLRNDMLASSMPVLSDKALAMPACNLAHHPLAASANQVSELVIPSDESMSTTAVLKGIKCALSIQNFEFHCLETVKMKQAKHFFPFETRNIVCATHEGSDVTLRACTRRKGGRSGSKFKKLALTFASPTHAEQWCHRLNILVWGDALPAVREKAVLILYDKYEGQSQMKLAEKYMKEVLDAAGKPVLIRGCQFTEFGLNAAFGAIDMTTVSNVICMNNEALSETMQILVRSQMTTNPIVVTLEDDPIDAALSILRSSIGASKKTMLQVSAFTARRDESKFGGLFARKKK